MIQLKREKVEKVYDDNWINIHEEKTYHYDTEKEFEEHKEKMEERGFSLELRSDLNLGDSECDILKIAGYYTKLDTVKE